MFAALYAPALVASPLVAGLDERFGGTALPWTALGPGLLLYVLGAALVAWTAATNPYLEGRVARGAAQSGADVRYYPMPPGLAQEGSMTHEKTVYTLRVERREVRLRHSAIGIQVRLERGTLLAAPGAPALPVRTLHVALPAGHTGRGVTARVLSVESLTGAHARVAPVIERGVAVQVPGARGPRYVAPDPDAYAAAVRRGRVRPAWLDGTSWLGEVPVATVHVQALRFGPDGELELIREIEITVEHEEIATRAPRRPAAFTLRRHAVARARVVNPAQVDEAPHPERPPRPPVPGPAPLPGPGLAGPAPERVPADITTTGWGYLPARIDYLIVTDHTRWSNTICPPTAASSSPPGELSIAFERLAESKRARGLSAHIVRLSAVLEGAFGDFTTGARDLQEVLRNFLKSVVESRGVQYVLLAGDRTIIPPRLVCGSVSWGSMGSKPKDEAGGGNAPAEGSCSVRDGFLALHLHPKVLSDDGPDYPGGSSDHILTMLASGRRVPYDDGAPAGGTALRWFYCTDDAYDTLSPVLTQYARVEGPASVMNDAPQWYVPSHNLIPSDLYYASLYGPTYDQPGKHDWDQLGNGQYGLYGQWSLEGEIGGAAYTRDVHVGRAPVTNLDEANVFVDKVLAYETSPSRPETWERFSQMVIAATNWGKGWDYMERKAGDAPPPDAHEYVYDSAIARTLMRSKAARDHPGGQMFAYRAAGDPVLLSYDAAPGPGRTGWYYAVSESDLLSPSEYLLPMAVVDGCQITLSYAKPTEWLVVHSDNASLLTPASFGYDPNDDLDGSITGGEEVYELMRTYFDRVDHITRLYTDESDLPEGAGTARPLTKAALRDALNAGPHLFTMSGHGNVDNIAWVLTRWDMLPELVNGEATFITFANSCLTAAFDTKNCLGEALVTRAEGGAVAYVGFSRSSWISTAWELQLAFFESLRTVRQLGAMFDSLTAFALSSHKHRWHMRALTLFGDPEMCVYRDSHDVRPFFIGNRASKEMHGQHCPWAELMWAGNAVRLETIAEGLSLGYDGCYYCLREHHTR